MVQVSVQELMSRLSAAPASGGLQQKIATGRKETSRLKGMWQERR